MPDPDHAVDRARRQQDRPLQFLTNFRDEIKAVVRSINIARMDNTDRVRQVAQSTIDELFSLMNHRAAIDRAKPVMQLVPDFTAFLASL